MPVLTHFRAIWQLKAYWCRTPVNDIVPGSIVTQSYEKHSCFLNAIHLNFKNSANAMNVVLVHMQLCQQAEDF